MTTLRPDLCAFALALFAVGCGSDSGRRDQHSDWPGTAVGPAVRVFSGTTATVADGAACTAEEGVTGDRWCAFVALSDSGTRNLFVVNLSQVVAGVPVSCDAEAPDPNCLFLTDEVGGSGANWHLSYFGGDTLVYYDATMTPYAWRPGMDSGRLLANKADGIDLAFCRAGATGTGVACLAIPNEQPDPTLVVAELYAGTADGNDEPLLTRVDSVIPGNLLDDNVRRFSFGSPASGYLAWTSRESPDGPELLKLMRADDPSSLLTIASDVHNVNVSADATQWAWQSAVDETGTGVLQTAAFPDGAYPSDVLGNVWDYNLDGSGALVARTFDANLISIPDPAAAPENQLLIDHDVQGLLRLSEQGHIAYTKHSAGNQIADLFVSKLDGTGACTLDTSVSVPLNSLHFAPEAAAAIWARSQTQGYDAFHTRLDDCTSVPLASDIVRLSWIGRGTAAFVDEFDATSGAGSLRLRTIAQNGALDPAPPILVAEHVDTYASAGSALLYTVNAGGDDDGVYVRAFAP